MLKRVALPCIIGATVLAASCSIDDPVLDPDSSGGTVVVGAGDSRRSELIAEIYAGALARAGVDTTVVGEGDRARSLAQLDAGEVTLVSEQSGRFLDFLNPGATETTPDDVFEALNRALPQGLSSTDYAVADDRLTVVATADTVRRLEGSDLETIGPRCGELTVGAASPLPESAVTALRTEYGCTFAGVRPYDPTDLVRALSAGEIQLAILPGASTVLFQGDVVPLTDDAHAFEAQNVVPIFRTGALPDAGILKLNIVGAELTTSDLAELTAKLEQGMTAGEAARDWLDQRGL